MKLLLTALFLLIATAFGTAQTYQLTATQNDQTLGVITFRLLPEVAPKHAAFVAARIADGFYNGSAFHRVIPNFMIQGGDPNSINGPRYTWGTGGYSEAVEAEFGSTPHVRGTISAARTSDPNSFRGQFFICVAPASWLNGQYSVFGEVTSGMDVADKIVSAPRDGNDNPYDKITMQIAEVTTSVQEENAEQPLMIYPQPARSTAVITTSQDAVIRILDVNGNQIKELAAAAGASTIDVSHLPCGAYVVIAESSAGVSYRPMLVTDR